MTQTKVIGESVKRTDRNFVKAYTDDYAKAITENYRQYHIHTLTGNLSGNYPEYAREQLDAIENGTANLMWFKVYSGKKYYKIVQQEFETWEKSKYYGQYRDSSVHSFVDKETGEVYKHHQFPYLQSNELNHPYIVHNILTSPKSQIPVGLSCNIFYQYIL